MSPRSWDYPRIIFASPDCSPGCSDLSATAVTPLAIDSLKCDRARPVRQVTGRHRPLGAQNDQELVPPSVFRGGGICAGLGDLGQHPLAALAHGGTCQPGKFDRASAD